MDTTEGLQTDYAVVNGAKAPASSDLPKPSEEGIGQDVFWKSVPQDDVVWHLPPVALAHSKKVDSDEAARLVDGFAAMLHDQPGRALSLKWYFQTRAMAAAAEHREVTQTNRAMLEKIRAQAELELESVERQLKDKTAQYIGAATEFSALQMELAKAMAGAGLAVFTDTVHESAKVTAEEVRPASTRFTHVVEDSINELMPTVDEIAGSHGVLTTKKESTASLIIGIFMQFVAPLVAGLLLAVCLGTLIGLLDIDTLLRPDGLPRVALSAALGFVIVYLMGEVVRTVMVLAAGTQEHYDESPRKSPRLKSAVLLTAVAATLCCVLAIGEITAEGLGLRMLHTQEVTREMRFKGTNTTMPADEPLIVYMLIGTLISGPYLLYKATHTWREAGDNMRDSWLQHMQRRWEAEFRKEPSVNSALSLAHRADKSADLVAQIEGEVAVLNERRASLRNADLPAEMAARAESSRAAAVGEMNKLNEMIEGILDATEPLRTRVMPTRPSLPPPPEPGFFARLLGRK